MKKVENDLNTLFWPSTLNESEFLSLSASTGRSVESSVWNTSLVVEDLVQVLLSGSDAHTLQNSSGVVGIFETGSDVSSLGEDG